MSIHILFTVSHMKHSHLQSQNIHRFTGIRMTINSFTDSETPIHYTYKYLRVFFVLNLHITYAVEMVALCVYSECFVIAWLRVQSVGFVFENLHTLVDFQNASGLWASFTMHFLSFLIISSHLSINNIESTMLIAAYSILSKRLVGKPIIAVAVITQDTLNLI